MSNPVVIIIICILAFMAVFCFVFAILNKFATSAANVLLKIAKYIVFSPFYFLFVPIKWPEKMKRKNSKIASLWILPIFINIPLAFLLIWWILVDIFYAIYLPLWILIQLIRLPFRITKFFKQRKKAKAAAIERSKTIIG